MIPRHDRCGLLSLLVGSICLSYTTSYPLIVEVPENANKCFRFNVPKDDDAHMVFMAMPSSLPSDVEQWYVDQVVTMTKKRNMADGGPLPRKFENQPPDDMLKDLDKFMEENGRKSNLQLRIEHPRNPRPLRQQELSWFLPAVLNHVERFQSKINEWIVDSHLDGYYVCFDNRSDQNLVHVIFDIVLVSDDLEEDADGVGVKKRHLSPLEQELAASVNAATSIINEMRYLEKREARMRITTESINKRIRYFSYLSVVILLTVTFLQVTYLKRYFKKKKLM